MSAERERNDDEQGGSRPRRSARTARPTRRDSRPGARRAAATLRCASSTTPEQIAPAHVELDVSRRDWFSRLICAGPVANGSSATSPSGTICPLTRAERQRPERGRGRRRSRAAILTTMPKRRSPSSTSPTWCPTAIVSVIWLTSSIGEPVARELGAVGDRRAGTAGRRPARRARPRRRARRARRLRCDRRATRASSRSRP